MERGNGKRNFFTAPWLEDCIVRWGRKCFYDVHLFSTTKNGRPIPPDACPMGALAGNLRLFSVIGQGEKAQVAGTYDLFSWFKFNKGRCFEVLERRSLPFEVFIPLHRLPQGFYPLHREKDECLSQVCGVNLSLKAVKVQLEEKGEKRAGKGEFYIKVVVQNDLAAFEHLLQPIQPITPQLFLKKTFPKPKEVVKPTAPAAIKGLVTDFRGSPLSKVQITVSSKDRSFSISTNFNGSFLLPLYPDTYQLTVAKRGYIARTSQLHLESGEIKKIACRLEPSQLWEGLG